MSRRRRREERGSATVFVIGLAVTLTVCAGLVVDGGNALNARARLADDVEQAARAGAQEIDLDALHSVGGGELVVDPVAAQDRATKYLIDRGYHGIVVTATTNSVTVHAEDTEQTKTLQLIGIGQFDVAATATSEVEINP